MIIDKKQNLRDNFFIKNITSTNKKITKIKNQNEEHTYIYMDKSRDYSRNKKK